MLKDLTLNRLKIVLNHFQSLRILVVGDFVLDQCWTLSDQIATIKDTTIRYGTMPQFNLTNAGGVVRNLKALGIGNIVPIGLLGADGYGWQIRELLSVDGCELDQLFIAANWTTSVRLRPQPINRDDPNNNDQYEIRSDQPLTDSACNRFLECIDKQIRKSDAIIICDPFPEKEEGFFTSEFRKGLSELATDHEEKPFWVDSPSFFNEYQNMTCLVDVESLMSQKSSDDEDEGQGALDPSSEVPCYEEIQKEAIIVRSRMRRPVFVNLSESGIMSCDRSTSLIPGLANKGTPDLWGGSEAVLATAAASSATGASSIESAQIGVLSAVEVFSQKGTPGSATAEAIAQRFAEMPKKH